MKSRFVKERGATLVEIVLVMPVFLLIVFVGLDLITMYRYAAKANSIVRVTARVFAVDRPADRDFAFNVVSADRLRVPMDDLSIRPYLSDYYPIWMEGDTDSFPTYPMGLLRALNLGLGYSVQILGDGYVTPDEDWRPQYSRNIKKGEFILVPHQVDPTDRFAFEGAFTVCIGAKTLFIPSIVRRSSSIHRMRHTEL